MHKAICVAACLAAWAAAAAPEAAPQPAPAAARTASPSPAQAAPAAAPAGPTAKPASAPAAAARARAPALPKPAPELAQLKLFAASFACTGSAEASPVVPAHATTGTFAGRVEADKYWLLAHFAEKKTKENPLPQEADEHWGYDAAAKSFIRVVVDGLGGYGFLAAPGWEDDKLVFTGEYHLGAEKALFRETFAKADGGFTLTAELQQDGQWTALGSTHCKKSAAK